jgi:hypothetical protein
MRVSVSRVTFHYCSASPSILCKHQDKGFANPQHMWQETRVVSPFIQAPTARVFVAHQPYVSLPPTLSAPQRLSRTQDTRPTQLLVLFSSSFMQQLAPAPDPWSHHWVQPPPLLPLLLPPRRRNLCRPSLAGPDQQGHDLPDSQPSPCVAG